MKLFRLVATLVAGLSGCSAGESRLGRAEGAPCGDETQCGEDMGCVVGYCRGLCEGPADCGTTWICDGGVCLPADCGEGESQVSCHLPPTIVPADSASIAVFQPLTLSFDAPIDPSSVELSGSLATESDGGRWVDERTLEISPAPEWQPAELCSLTVSATSAAGLPYPTLGVHYDCGIRFVRPDSGAGDGSRNAPFSTVEVAHVDLDGFRRLYLAAGTYPIGNDFLLAGLEYWGGFDAADWSLRDPATARTVLQAGPTTVGNGGGITFHTGVIVPHEGHVVIDGIEIDLPALTVPAGTADLRQVALEATGADLEIRDSVVTAGGLTRNGGAGSLFSYGLLAPGGAVVERCQVSGGDISNDVTAGDFTHSCGLFADGPGTLWVADSALSAGAVVATTGVARSTAMLSSGGDERIIGNTLRATSATVTDATAGATLALVGGYEAFGDEADDDTVVFSNNTAELGTAIAPDDASTRALVLVNQHAVTVMDNTLRVHKAEGYSAVVYGIFVESPGALHSSATIGGNHLEFLPTDPETDAALCVRGIMVSGTVDAEISDNEIIGRLRTIEPREDLASAGILSESERPLLIQRNIIRILAAYDWSYGIHVNRDLPPFAVAIIRNNLIQLAAVNRVSVGILGVGFGSLRADNNTIIGGGSATGAGDEMSLALRIQNTPSSAPIYVRNNLFEVPAGDPCWEIDVPFEPGAADYNNFFCSGQCPGSDCPSENNSSMQVHYQDRTAQDFRLGPNANAILRSGGLDLSDLFDDDLTGALRVGPWSRGAYQASE